MDHQESGKHHVRITAHGDEATVEIDGERVDPSVHGAYTITPTRGEPAHVLFHVRDGGSHRTYHGGRALDGGRAL